MPDADGERTTMRLAKLIAQRGVASRRAAEQLIEQGLVTVNGEVASVTTPVDPERDAVEVNGTPLPAEPEKSYYVLNKPKGYITTRFDPRGRKSVLDLVAGLPVRVEAVGRLDYDTEGALLLTNDGELAHRLTHPSHEVPKRYIARVKGRATQATIAALKRGVLLEDGPTLPAEARVVSVAGDSSTLEITVTEGRNRMIRRMMMTLGHPVIDLRRDSIAAITIEGLPLGETRPLTKAEVASLRAAAGTRKPRPRVRAPRPPKAPRPPSKSRTRVDAWLREREGE